MIYCVEDERNIRELLVYTLGTTGFEAKGFGDGKEFKKALKEELPELILLDIMLPGEDGYTLLEELKKAPSTSEIPVIMVTAKEAEYDKVRGLEGGADDYITKPFGMMEFLARVKAVLRYVHLRFLSLPHIHNPIFSLKFHHGLKQCPYFPPDNAKAQIPLASAPRLCHCQRPDDVLHLRSGFYNDTPSWRNVFCFFEELL